MEGISEELPPPVAAEQGSTDSLAAPNTNTGEDAAPSMSKNALKKLKKRQKWEDGREDRARIRKEKRVALKSRKREQRNELISQGIDPASLRATKTPSTLVPIALILDCDFEQYMLDKERISLASQITRSYSDNQKARFKTHFWIDGWAGKLKDRFETVLGNQSANWRAVGFEEGNFLEAAVKARDQMQQKGGQVIEALQSREDRPALTCDDTADLPEVPPLDPAYSDVIYLSSDSPYTLQRLEANTSYVIGGLVDKNREKGLCHRRATERGIRTARLPIGNFMMMQSRKVLATNHVVEIMLKWLECEDWGEAFMSVIPKRKGGVLKCAAGQEVAADDADEAGDQEDEQEAAAGDGAGVEAVTAQSAAEETAEKS